jgi:hypothetical protein
MRAKASGVAVESFSQNMPLFYRFAGMVCPRVFLLATLHALRIGIAELV